MEAAHGVSAPDRSLRDRLAEHLGAPFDGFQVAAMDALDEGASVLVAAPTSSGKTVVANYATLLALEGGQRIFYTTPIKALSNQKFRDLRAWLGAEQVGLLTGDNSIRGQAPVVVMTTEVLRNMIYTGSTALTDLAYVVLDEVHYLQDAYRGPVWEEVIIQLDRSVRLVCLSATVSNSAEVAEWIRHVRGHTVEVTEHHRPVPLRSHFLVADRHKERLREFPVLRGQRPNPEVFKFLDSGQARTAGRRSRSRLGPPRRADVVAHLRTSARLPVIYFIFSRQACDDAARAVAASGPRLLDASQRDRVAAIAAEHTCRLSPTELAVLDHGTWLEGLSSGVAAHHAGLVPPFKETVEECFAAGLLQVVFATETLAMGVNLPARSVVIESLSRFRGEGHVFLTPADYTQLTGRAGRRGIDDEGHAFTMWSRWVDFGQVAALAASDEFELRSAFRPTYNMAANLVEGRSRLEVEQILQLSFAQFHADRELDGLAEAAQRAHGKLEEAESEYRERYGDPDVDIAAAAQPRRQRDGRETEIATGLRRLRPGDVLVDGNRTGHSRLLVLGVGQRRGGGLKLRVLSPAGKTLVLGPRDFLEPPEVAASIDLPRPFAPYRPAFQRAAAELLRQVDTGAQHAWPEPAAADDDPDRRKLCRRVERGRTDVARAEQRLEGHGRALVATFERICSLLGRRGYLDGWQVTERGRLLQRIFHEKDLLVAEALGAGLFDGLDAAETAALTSTFTYEHRSPSPPPPPWFPHAAFAARFALLESMARELRSDERANELPETAEPDAGFVPFVHAWTSGVELEEILGEEELSGGDFVRQMRQVTDLLSQLGKSAPTAPTRATARQAVRLVDRGLVAASAHLDA